MTVKKFLACSLVLCLPFALLPNKTEGAGRELPKDVFEWVQSTSMSGYYFNKQQICYGTSADGYIDLNKLIVPTIKIYSGKQIEDVVQKRRWRMEKLDGYNDLVGAADYLTFDVAAQTVTIVEHDDLDKNWWPLAKVTEPKTIKIAELSDKAVDGIFYRTILKWSNEHSDEIMQHTVLKGLSLNPADKERWEKNHRKDK